jgi:hypothetical protein
VTFCSQEDAFPQKNVSALLLEKLQCNSSVTIRRRSLTPCSFEIQFPAIVKIMNFYTRLRHGSVWRAPDPEGAVSNVTKARAWLRRGLVNYGRHFGSREFLRNNFNVTSIGGAIAVIDQIWFNGKMTLPEILRSRLIATVVDLAGAGDVTVSGHGEWLRLWKITPESPDWKRRAVEWPLMVVGVAAWNFGQYFLGGVAPSHFFRSVCISSAIGVVVQVGVLRANAVLNNYATHDPRYCQSMSGRLSKTLGCRKFSAKTKKQLYWGAIAGLNAFMLANWAWGEKLRQAVLGH